jgi:ketopantoate reductase
LSIFGKSIPRSVAFLSFKRYKWKDLTLEIAKPSPIKWMENSNIKDFVDIVNTYTNKSFNKYLFEWVDSIALQREGEIKAIINSILNSIGVIYKSNVQDAIKSFKEEFWETAISDRAEEISNIENTTLKDSPFEINTGEMYYRILHTAEKFAQEKSSTYQQYFINAQSRWKVLSEDDHLLWNLIQRARNHSINAPISNEVWNRMKKIEAEINKNVA